MELKDILAVSGKSGLFKMISQGKNALIVESLDTGKRIPVYSHQRVSSMEDIAVFTEGEDIPLKEVLKRIHVKESGEPAPVSKKMSGEELKNYFEDLVPEYDEERVYVSDMKKILSWYNTLIKAGINEWAAEKEEESKVENKESQQEEDSGSDEEEKNQES